MYFRTNKNPNKTLKFPKIAMFLQKIPIFLLPTLTVNIRISCAFERNFKRSTENKKRTRGCVHCTAKRYLMC